MLAEKTVGDRYLLLWEWVSSWKIYIFACLFMWVQRWDEQYSFQTNIRWECIFYIS